MIQPTAAALDRLPAETRRERLAQFLATSFPPLALVPGCLVHFGAVFLGLQALARPGLAGRLALPPAAIVGAVTVVLFSLLMRTYDELKDVATDIRLGRAGDPKYRDKAIVTGHLTADDLMSLRWAVTGLLFFVNATVGSWLGFGTFVAVFSLMWLSYKWFFCPPISRQLLLAFVTHNPITAAVELYILALVVADFGGIEDRVAVGALVLALWFPVASWETGRKIRAAQDETDYMTYSKVLGWRVAALVPAAFTAASAGLLLFVGARLALGSVFAVAVVAGAAVTIGACVRFFLSGESAHAKLQPMTELFALVANLGFLIAVTARYGVSPG